MSYQRLSWNQSGPNSIKRERMLSAFELNKFIGFSDGMFNRIVYWKSHFCRTVLCAFALVLEVCCRCWIYLACREGSFRLLCLKEHASTSLARIRISQVLWRAAIFVMPRSLRIWTTSQARIRSYHVLRRAAIFVMPGSLKI